MTREWADNPPEPPYAFIQWKGTNVCMDVHCICGSLVHIDADFAYFIECLDCHRKYSMSWYVQMKELTEEQAEKEGYSEGLCWRNGKDDGQDD